MLKELNLLSISPYSYVDPVSLQRPDLPNPSPLCRLSVFSFSSKNGEESYENEMRTEIYFLPWKGVIYSIEQD